jgi:hypothetical protein
MVRAIPHHIKAWIPNCAVSRDTAKFPAMNPMEGTKNHKPYSADVWPSTVTTTCGAAPRKLKNGADPSPAQSA